MYFRTIRRRHQPEEYLEDDQHLTSGQVVIAGARWRLIMQVGQQLLSMLATFALARLLTPADFGIVAISVSTVTFLQLGTQWGFNASIVRLPRISSDLLRGMFTLSAAIGISLSILGIFLSPWVASLIDRRDAVSAIAVLMPVVAIQALGLVPSGLLQRRMQFKGPAVVALVATAVYVATQVLLALAGAGYWSVIIGQIVMVTIIMIGNFVLSGWAPSLGDPRAAWRQEGKYSTGVFANETLQYFNKNSDYWYVGAQLGASALGTYYISFVVPSILRLRVSYTVQAVLFPVFSRLNGAVERTQAVYVRAIGVQAAAVLPVLAGLIVLAPEIVQVFFGSQWSQAVPPLRWIALAAAFDLLATAQVAAAYAHSLMRRLVWVNAIRAAALALGLVVITLTGPTLALVGVVVAVSSCIALAVSQVLIADRLNLKIRLVGRDVLVPAVSTVIMASVVALARGRLTDTDLDAFSVLVLTSALGACVYVTIGLIAWRSRFIAATLDVAAVLLPKSALTTFRRRYAAAGRGGGRLG